ncbi:EAL domain-containing protein, partial [Cedecea sp. AS113]
ANGDTPVLDAIITLSKRLKLTMIAEGISTRKQALFMRNNQVMLLQGYLFSPPLDAANFRTWYLRNEYNMNITPKM